MCIALAQLWRESHVRPRVGNSDSQQPLIRAQTTSMRMRARKHARVRSNPRSQNKMGEPSLPTSKIFRFFRPGLPPATGRRDRIV